MLGGAQVTLVAAITLLTVPLPAIQRDFGLGPGDLALPSSAYGLTAMAPVFLLAAAAGAVALPRFEERR